MILLFAGLVAVAVLALEFGYDSRDEARTLWTMTHGMWPATTYEEALRALRTHHDEVRDAYAMTRHGRGAAEEPAAAADDEASAAA